MKSFVQQQFTNVVATAFLLWPASLQAMGSTVLLHEPPDAQASFDFTDRTQDSPDHSFADRYDPSPHVYSRLFAESRAIPYVSSIRSSPLNHPATERQSAAGNAPKGISVTDTRPNFVVIMTDDQDDMGSLGHMPKTQSLLGGQGLTFTNSFTDFPLCCPSRASFLTGQAAHNTGVLSNTPVEDGGYAFFQPTENNSLPVWLQQAGYHTVHMGKYLNGFGPSYPIPPGWTTWQGIADGQGSSYYYNYTINRNGVLQLYGSSPADYKTDVQAHDAEAFIASQQTAVQPFFVWLNPFAPHMALDPADPTSLTLLPPIPAPRHVGLYDNFPLPSRPNFNESDVSDKPAVVKLFPLLDSAGIADAINQYRRRRESLLSVDDMVERVINALQAAGKLSNTYIIFTSDNGNFEGQHRRRSNKMLVYEESIRVPLLIRGPGIPAGQTRTQLVNNLDLVATIETLAGITPGRIPDGRTLVPLFLNAAAPWRSSVLVQGMNKVIGIAHLYGRYQAVRTNRYVYAEHNGDFGFEREFYDLATDPYQLVSKPNDPAYASIVGDLQGRLGTLRTCVGASCWMTTPEPPPPPGFFFTVPPCRLLDTRNAHGPLGGPALSAGLTRSFGVLGHCAIPATARAISVNMTVAQGSAAGHLTVFAGGTSQPLVSSVNYRAGQTRANNAVVQLGSVGDLAVISGQPSGTVHFILDVNGYFE